MSSHPIWWWMELNPVSSQSLLELGVRNRGKFGLNLHKKEIISLLNLVGMCNLDGGLCWGPMLSRELRAGFGGQREWCRLHVPVSKSAFRAPEEVSCCRHLLWWVYREAHTAKSVGMCCLTGIQRVFKNVSDSSSSLVVTTWHISDDWQCLGRLLRQ